MSQEEFVPNERLRRARILKGWSQVELAEKVGTGFEMVSRWERGLTVPGLYYRKRLLAVLEKSAEELGLIPDYPDPFIPPTSPLVLFASSHADAEKASVSQLKTTLQGHGFALLSSRQLGRQGIENSRTVLREVVQAAQVILIIVSTEARSSRHVREALEIAGKYQRPVCGVWIEGEHLEHCLPEGHVDLAALIDARQSETPTLLAETSRALEHVWRASEDGIEGVPLASLPGEIHLSTYPSEPPGELIPPRSQVAEGVPAPSHSLEPANTARPMPRGLPESATPPIPGYRTGLSRIRIGLLIGLAFVVVAGGILGSLSLLAHWGVLGTRSTSVAINPIRGGIWIDVSNGDPYSLIPNGGLGFVMDQALYLPLFYGDAQGVIHPGAATELPSLQNGGISADAKTWIFHLRPKLVWSDGQPYDARDVDYSWKLWLNPKFGADSTFGLNLITSADVSADQLSITFHLKQAFAPFLSVWVDGAFAPLPMHHFSGMAPEAILKSPENLNPQVVSGAFMMSESQPGDHYTLVRNPRYYRASQGLPYLDKIVFRIVDADTNLKNLEAGSITSSPLLVGERLSHYTLVTTPTSAGYEALYFNFHNTVLATHLEVRQAMAMAIDHRALVNVAPLGLWTPLCTDHPSALHPGYDPNARCPVFDLAAAKKLLSDNGWVIGPDGVRSKQGQRLEFEYSTSIDAIAGSPRSDVQAIIQRNFKKIGIQLDIQDYPHRTFFGSFLPSGKASPPSGAVAGRFDIAEYENDYGYDPDDSIQFACNQFPPQGQNFGYYCNRALDALFQQELEASDQGVRQQIFEQIHQIYLTEFPFITLFSPLTGDLVHKGIHNFQPSPIAAETVNIWEWWCDNGKC